MTSVIDMVRDAVRQLRNTAGEVVPVDDSDPGRRVSALAATGRLTVAPGQTIASAWGNTTYDQTVQTFDSAAMRDNQWPAPKDGAVCFTADTKTYWQRVNGAWVAPQGSERFVNYGYNPIAGTYNAAKPIVPVVVRDGAGTGPTGILLVRLPAGTTCIVAVALTADAPAAGETDGPYLIALPVNSTPTQLAVQARDRLGPALNKPFIYGGVVYVQF